MKKKALKKVKELVWNKRNKRSSSQNHWHVIHWENFCKIHLRKIIGWNSRESVRLASPLSLFLYLPFWTLGRACHEINSHSGNNQLLRTHGWILGWSQNERIVSWSRYGLRAEKGVDFHALRGCLQSDTCPHWRWANNRLVAIIYF